MPSDVVTMSVRIRKLASVSRSVKPRESVDSGQWTVDNASPGSSLFIVHCPLTYPLSTVHCPLSTDHETDEAPLRPITHRLPPRRRSANCDFQPAARAQAWGLDAPPYRGHGCRAVAPASRRADRQLPAMARRRLG